MRVLIVACVFLIPVDAAGWQLAVGGGVTTGLIRGAISRGTVTGWDILGQWTRQPFVGQRWAVDLDVGQFGTGSVRGGLLARGRIASAALLWERRVPLRYGFRPWVGIGAGLDHVRYDDRLQLDSRGYAIQAYPATHETSACLQAAIVLPIGFSWSVAVLGSTDFPGHISTITMILTWRLL